MIITAAYTGARRSELLRSQIEDFDMELGFLTIREKKRVRSQHSTRRVPICDALRPVLEGWFDEHPGGLHAFTIDSTPLTPDQAHDYFVRTFKKTKWTVLRGWHALRHSFISCLASKGIDQRIIDEFSGHQSESMRRRYRHLFPNVQRLHWNLSFQFSYSICSRPYVGQYKTETGISVKASVHCANQDSSVRSIGE